MKKFVAGLLSGVLIAGISCHTSQIEDIDKKNEEIRLSIGKAQGTTREDLQKVLQVVNCETTYGGGCEWILGDFDVREGGEARCGGIAKTIALEAANYGFDSEILLEFRGLKAHYYAILKRDSQEFEIRGTPPDLHFKEIR